MITDRAFNHKPSAHKFQNIYFLLSMFLDNEEIKLAISIKHKINSTSIFEVFKTQFCMTHDSNKKLVMEMLRHVKLCTTQQNCGIRLSH